MTPSDTSELFTVDSHADGVSCDGGHGALGHPKVWYSFDGQSKIECSYCGRSFVKAH